MLRLLIEASSKPGPWRIYTYEFYVEAASLEGAVTQVYNKLKSVFPDRGRNDWTYTIRRR